MSKPIGRFCAIISTAKRAPIGSGGCRPRFGRRRIAYFNGNVYRHGLLGRFIGLSHILLRAYGVDPRGFLRTRTREEQKHYFDTVLSPLFDKKLIRWLTSFRTSLYGLGIPPAQYELLASAGAAISSAYCASGWSG